MGWAGIHAIEDDAVEMRIRVESGTKTLNRCDRTALGALHTVMDASAAPLVGEE